MRTIASAWVLLLGLLAAACNGELVAGGLTPAQVVVVSGDLQSATVGTELPQPLVVRVVDDRGRPVKNQLVNFVVTAGGGSVFAGAAITNADGEARERWRLGTVAGDTQRVEARAVDPATGQALVFAVFRAVATPAGAASISAVQPAMSGQPGTPMADSAAALVHDQYGNPVPGVTVSWAVTSGGGSVSPASSTTSAQGIARAQWTLGGSVVTPHTLRASAGASMNATFTATAAVGPGASLTAVSGSGQTSQIFTPFPQPLVVEVRQNGVPVQGAQVQWTTSSSTGRFGEADQATVTTATDAQGRASVVWKPGSQAGTQTSTATLMDASVNFTGTVTAGTPNTLGAMGIPATAAPGTTLAPRYRLTDGYGNPVAGVEVQFSATRGTVTPATATTDANGYIDVTWTLPTQLGFGNFQATAQISAQATSAPASSTQQTTILAVPTKILASVDSATVAAGTPIRFNASLQDDFGNNWSPRGYNGCGVGWSGPAEVELTPIFGLEYPRVNVLSNTPGTYTITVVCNPLGLTDTVTLTVT